MFTDFKHEALQIDDDPTKTRVKEGELFFGNNTWFKLGTLDASNLANLTKNKSAEEIQLLAADRGNKVEDPKLRGISRTADGKLDPRPSADSPLLTSAISPFPVGQAGFYSQANYRGAFGSVNWLSGWSYISRAGFVSDEASSEPGKDIDVTENITINTTWESKNAYLLGKPIFVTSGATLTIQPGTTIYGYEDETAGTFGSLVITRGAKIMAEGNKDKPIVFTARDARIKALTLEDSSLWGGLIILGKAILNDADNPIINPTAPKENTREIEGFPSGGDASLIRYGGLDDNDNSGVLRYVSIRFGGVEFRPDNEINGLTLGAVGRGTKIEYVEVFNNSDDGVELFGGTVDLKFMVMAFNEDEAFDIDQGYRGRGQFLFAIQKDVGKGSNHAGEHDGGDSPNKTLEPFARSKFFNVTYIGSGVGGKNPQLNSVFRLKDNFAGQYHNSVFTDFKAEALQIDDDLTKSRVNAGDLLFSNNTWFGFGTANGTDLASLTKNRSAEELLLLSADRGNRLENPNLRGVSRLVDKGLDPRPRAASSLLSSPTTAIPSESVPFYTSVDYRGAFGEENWMNNWTYLSQAGYLGDLPAGGGVTEGIDTDKDGADDVSEALAGTDPKDPKDKLRIISVVSATDRRALVWTSKTGKNYEVQYSTDLRTWTAIGSLSGASDTASFEDKDAGRAHQAGYFRIAIK